MKNINTLTYSALRNKIRNGDIFLTANSSLISRVIRFFTRSEISHVGMFLNISGRIFIVEATGNGVVMTLASERVEKEKKAWWGRIDHQVNAHQIELRLLKRLGRKYDTIGAILSPFRRKDDEDNFCSELVEEVLNLKSQFSKRGTTPDDIARLLIKSSFISQK